MNPCPCGYYGDTQKPCSCVSALVTKYQKRISNPLLDCIGIYIEASRVDYEKLSGNRMGASSEAIRARVQAAPKHQTSSFYESRISTIEQRLLHRYCLQRGYAIGQIRQRCKLQDVGQNLMQTAMTQRNLSARAYHRILKKARTIADLAGSGGIKSVHLPEAL